MADMEMIVSFMLVCQRCSTSYDSEKDKKKLRLREGEKFYRCPKCQNKFFEIIPNMVYGSGFLFYKSPDLARASARALEGIPAAPEVDGEVI